MDAHSEPVVDIPWRWWERLDEWHHGRFHNHPRLSRAWHVLWRPVCDYRDRRYGWKP